MKTPAEIRTDLSKPNLSNTGWANKTIIQALFDIVAYLEAREGHSQEQSHDPDHQPDQHLHAD